MSRSIPLVALFDDVNFNISPMGHTYRNQRGFEGGASATADSEVRYKKVNVSCK